MKKIILTAASLIALTAAANAGSLPCNPATGNWVNAATTTCPPLGSGAVGASYVDFFNARVANHRAEIERKLVEEANDDYKS